MIHKVSVHFMWAFMLLVITLSAYGYEYAKVSEKSTEAATLGTQIAQQNNATAKAALAKSELSQISGQEAEIGQYFVSTTDVVPFIEKIQAIGKFLGADIQVVSVSAQPASPYGSLNLSISISGSFDAVSRTIGAIEYEPYNTSITSLTMTTGSASQGGTPQVTISSSSPATLPVWNAAVVFSVGAQTGIATSTVDTVPVTTDVPVVTDASTTATTTSIISVPTLATSTTATTTASSTLAKVTATTTPTLTP